MADAGEIWYRALSGFGHSVGSGLSDAMQIYHERQEKLRMADATMAELNKTVSSNDPKTGEPNMVISDEDYQNYLHHSDKQRAVLFGAKMGAQKVLEQYGHAASATANAATASVKSQLAQQSLDQPLVEIGGRRYTRNSSGTLVPLEGRGGGGQAELNAIKEARIAAHQTAGLALKRRKEIQSVMQNETSYSPDEFLSKNFVPGVIGEDAKFTPQGDGPDFAIEHKGKDGATYEPFSGQDLNRYMGMASEHQKLGQTAFGGLTGGKQNAPVQVKTPADARKLPSGTIYQAPDGRTYQVP